MFVGFVWCVLGVTLFWFDFGWGVDYFNVAAGLWFAKGGSTARWLGLVWFAVRVCGVVCDPIVCLLVSFYACFCF